jgi:crotonobetainyl-CoA:carnitine CoA-transferase CaiB-like acyl-CoA transferase
LKTGHWQPAERAFMGPHLLPSAAYREGALPAAITQLAPTLGQHNEEVLRGLLGLGDEEIAALARDGIIGAEATRPKPKDKPARGSRASAAE